MPIPISIEEYQRIDDSSTMAKPTEEESQQTSDTPVVEEKKIYETDIKVGNTVEIIAGSMVGMVGEVKAIDLSKGIAKIEMEMFGRVTSIDVNFDEIKLSV
jgi:transcriptional antiterminator NusG